MLIPGEIQERIGDKADWSKLASTSPGSVLRGGMAERPTFRSRNEEEKRYNNGMFTPKGIMSNEKAGLLLGDVGTRKTMVQQKTEG